MRHLHDSDATDVFHSIHSKEAVARLHRMARTPVSADDEKPLPIEVNFRKLRRELEAKGFYDRNYALEAVFVGVVLVLTVSGFMLAHSHPWLAVVLLAFGQQQAGWSGHEYVHMRGRDSWWMGRLLSAINGFSPEWWSAKHNGHHAYTNHTDRDLDIQLSPVLYLVDPDPADDSPFRRFQHVYFLPVLSLLYASWRQQSLAFAWKRRNYLELGILAVNYAWLLLLPWKVFVGSVLLGGFLVGLIVTPTHQSEHFITPENRERYSFVREQFLTTRNAYNDNFFLRWVWGHMDSQLEHHLFPTMPAYHYYSVRPLVQQFAKENDIDYLEDGSFEILLRNMRTMHRVAKAAAKKHAT